MCYPSSNWVVSRMDQMEALQGQMTTMTENLDDRIATAQQWVDLFVYERRRIVQTSIFSCILSSRALCIENQISFFVNSSPTREAIVLLDLTGILFRITGRFCQSLALRAVIGALWVKKKHVLVPLSKQWACAWCNFVHSVSFASSLWTGVDGATYSRGLLS